MSKVKEILTELRYEEYPQGENGAAEIKASVTIEEKFGVVRISWTIDERFPIDKSIVQVSEYGTKDCTNYPITSHNGHIDTKYPWGSGYYGSFWSFHPESSKYVPVVSTAVSE